MNYIPIFIHSHYSVLQGLNNPKDIVTAAKNANMSAIALTDINNMAGCVEFYKSCKKENIKPIIGCLITTDSGTLLLIAVNNAGYIELLKITAELNSKKWYKNSGPVLNIDTLFQFDLLNIICIIGHEGSTLYKYLVENYLLKKEYTVVYTHLSDLSSLFHSVYIELQYSEYDKLSKEVKELYKEISETSKIPLVACPRVHYLKETDKELHQILISVKEKKPLVDINQINSPVYKFFDGYRFHLPTAEEFEKEIDNQEAIENTIKIANIIEDYNIEKLPAVPKFKCPDKKSTEEYFRELCESGFSLKIKDTDGIYRNRLEKEFAVFKEANLFDYFLILKDVMDYARSKGYLLGPGRGSSSSCLISFLLNITQVDPIKYNLIFARFFNSGRKDSLPDIDIDVPKRSREDIIQYIIKKYGKNNVSHISTYGTLVGRAALKAVFRAYNDLSFSEQNEITKNVPDKAKISDQLQEMKKTDENAGVIKWALLNKKKQLENWCTIEGEEFKGSLADKFEKASRLEGVIQTCSVHAAGIILSPTPLNETVPLIYDSKEKCQIIGIQMNELSTIGLTKYDILALANLDKLESINNFEE